MSRWTDKILGIDNNYKNNYTLADRADLEKIIRSKNPYKIYVTKDISLTWGGETGTEAPSGFSEYVAPNSFYSKFRVRSGEQDYVRTAIVNIEYYSASLAKIHLEFPPIANFSAEYFEIWVGLDGKYISYQAGFGSRAIPKKGQNLGEVFRGTIPTGTNTGTNSGATGTNTGTTGDNYCDLEMMERCCDKVPSPAIKCNCEDAHNYKINNPPQEVLDLALGIVKGTNGQFFYDDTSLRTGYASLTSPANKLFPAFYAANGKWYFDVKTGNSYSRFEIDSDGLNYKPCQSAEDKKYDCKDYLQVKNHAPEQPSDEDIAAFSGLYREGSRCYYKVGDYKFNAVFFYGNWLLEELMPNGCRVVYVYQKDNAGKYQYVESCDSCDPYPGEETPTDCNDIITVCCDNITQEYTVLDPVKNFAYGIGTHFYKMPNGAECEWFWTDKNCKSKQKEIVIGGEGNVFNQYTMKTIIVESESCGTDGTSKPRELPAYYVGGFWLVRDGETWYKVYENNMCDLIKCECGKIPDEPLTPPDGKIPDEPLTPPDGKITDDCCEELRIKIRELETRLALIEKDCCCDEPC